MLKRHFPYLLGLGFDGYFITVTAGNLPQTFSVQCQVINILDFAGLGLSTTTF